MSGITIGAGAVIATNAHAVKDVAPYEIVGGNPDTHIRHRLSADMVSLLVVLKWWELPIEAIRELVPLLSSNPTESGIVEAIRRYGE